MNEPGAREPREHRSCCENTDPSTTVLPDDEELSELVRFARSDKRAAPNLTIYVDQERMPILARDPVVVQVRIAILAVRSEVTTVDLGKSCELSSSSRRTTGLLPSSTGTTATFTRAECPMRSGSIHSAPPVQPVLSDARLPARGRRRLSSSRVCVRPGLRSHAVNLRAPDVEARRVRISRRQRSEPPRVPRRVSSSAPNADSGRAALAEGCFLGTAGLVLRRQTCPRVRARRTADSRHNLRRDGAAARPVLVRAGHAVGDVDPLRRDAERGEGVTLWVRFLFIAGDAGASEFEHRHRRGCRLASRHRDCSPNQSYGTRCPGRPRDWPLVKDGVGRGSGCGTVGGWMGSRGVSGGMTGLRQQLRKTVSRARRRCRPAVGRGRRA